jgi:hypothetical protein
VTNIVSASRPIEGKPVEGQAFTVVLKNVGDEIITFTEYEKILYRPRTNPGVSRSSGKWTLRPDAEWRLELFSGLVCRYGGGCNSSGGTQALIRIVLTGNDAKERPVRTQLDITLPPADIAQKPPIIR